MNLKRLLCLAVLLVPSLLSARTVTVHNTSELTSWAASQQAGDTVLLESNGVIGDLAAPPSITIKQPNVTIQPSPGFKPNFLVFTIAGPAAPGFQAVKVYTDFRGAAPTTGTVWTLQTVSKLINVFVHAGNLDGQTGRQCVLIPNGYARPVDIYGLGCFRGHHGVYTQNDAAQGEVHIRESVLAYATGCGGPGGNCTSYNVHGYTQSGREDSTTVQDSILYGGGRVMIGGQNNTSPVGHDNKYLSNVFYNLDDVANSYNHSASKGVIDGNILINSGMKIDAFLPGGWKVTNNTFYNATGGLLLYRPLDANGVPAKFDVTDTVDGNKFTADSTGKFKVTGWFPNPPGGMGPDVSMTTYHTKLQGNGCVNCEANASIVSMPAALAVLKANSYETNRGQLAVWTNGVTGLHNVAVSLAPTVAPGAYVRIVDAEAGPYATPAWIGTYPGGTIQLPVSGEFEAFFVIPDTAPTPTPTATFTATNTPTSTPTPTRTNTPPMICNTATPTPALMIRQR